MCGRMGALQPPSVPSVRKPPASYSRANDCLAATAWAGGSANSRIASVTEVSDRVHSATPPRRTNAFHCRRLPSSSMNVGVSAVGVSVGSGVRRRANVAPMAVLRTAPSNAKSCHSRQRSWISFIRLFVMPSATITSNFSATTVSRGYACRRGRGKSRKVSSSASVGGLHLKGEGVIVRSPR